VAHPMLALKETRYQRSSNLAFFNYPLDIRKAIYTTNSVESLNRSLRKIIKTRGGFPNEDAGCYFARSGSRPRNGPCPSITGAKR